MAKLRHGQVPETTLTLVSIRTGDFVGGDTGALTIDDEIAGADFPGGHALNEVTVSHLVGHFDVHRLLTGEAGPFAPIKDDGVTREVVALGAGMGQVEDGLNAKCHRGHPWSNRGIIYVITRFFVGR